MSNINIMKMDSDVLHFLPFKPTIRRQRGFSVVRYWGKSKLELDAKWTLNTFDLITFTQILDQFQKNKNNWEIVGEMGEGKFKREVIKMDLDIEKIVKHRNIRNVKNVRQGIFESLKRLFSIELQITNPENIILTKYLYDVEIIGNDFKKIITYVNKPFLEFCINQGLLFNFGRLIEYSKPYSILLDSFLQGTKSKTKPTNKKSKNGKTIYEYEYKNIYKEEELFEILYLNETKKNNFDKHKILEMSFLEINKRGGLPKYHYNKIEKIWIKEEYLGVLHGH